MTAERWDRDELERFRQQLLEREAQLRADILNELGKYDGEPYAALAGRVADPAERAIADLLVDINLAEITRDVTEVRAIEHALLRLAQGRFGDCTDCGGPIEAARLHYEPATPRCIDCQERFERRDAGPRHRSL